MAERAGGRAKLKAVATAPPDRLAHLSPASRDWVEGVERDFNVEPASRAAAHGGGRVVGFGGEDAARAGRGGRDVLRREVAGVSREARGGHPPQRAAAAY